MRAGHLTPGFMNSNSHPAKRANRVVDLDQDLDLITASVGVDPALERLVSIAVGVPEKRRMTTYEPSASAGSPTDTRPTTRRTITSAVDEA